MEKGGGKRKGKGAEWEIARLLSECWDETGRDDIFQPTNASGGQFTSRKKSGKNTESQGGDITFNDPCGKPLIDLWNIESKTGYTKKKSKVTRKSNIDKSCVETIQRLIETPFDAFELIDSQQEETQFEMFWNQCSRDAKVTNREPVLIFRRNKRQHCICFKLEYFRRIEYILFEYEFRTIIINLDIEEEKESLIVINFYEFLVWTGGYLKNLVTKLIGG